jgi:type 1 fimbria pilin
MTKHSTFLLLWGIFLLGCVSRTVNAQSTVHFNVTGRILADATCDLAAGDVNRQVMLESVNAGRFVGQTVVAPKTFTITANCDNASSVTFTFSGTAESSDTRQFKNTGTATGVALTLFSTDASGQSVAISPAGTGSDSQRTVPVINNVASLDLGAAYWNLGRPTAGTLVSKALVSITYQ